MTTETYSFERYLHVRSAYGASFSPDGKYLSFLTDITGVAEVWRVPVDVFAATPSWPEQVTFRGERVATAEFSPTDHTLLLTADVGGSELTQLYTVQSDGFVFSELTSQPEVIYTTPLWSPDGKRIVYCSNERDPRYFDVYQRSLEDDSIRLLLRDDGSNFMMAYSPDGKQVLVSRMETNIHNHLTLLDTTTGDAQRLTPEIGDGPAEYVYAAWSAD